LRFFEVFEVAATSGLGALPVRRVVALVTPRVAKPATRALHELMVSIERGLCKNLVKIGPKLSKRQPFLANTQNPRCLGSGASAVNFNATGLFLGEIPTFYNYLAIFKTRLSAGGAGARTVVFQISSPILGPKALSDLLDFANMDARRHCACSVRLA
jgi:hypothetical protein